MRVFRISTQEYIEDLSGTGSRLYGGRWNSPGISLVYTAPTRALAMAEVAVHLAIGMLDKEYAIAEIDLPCEPNDPTQIIRIQPESLTPGWNAFPPAPFTTQIGNAFVREGKALALEVPSAVVQGDFNILLNPAHLLAAKIKVIAVSPFAFDKRIIK